MSAQSGGADAASAKGNDTFASPQGCTPTLGKRKRDEEEEEAPVRFIKATHYEVVKMRQRAHEALGLTEHDLLIISGPTVVSGMEACQKRAKERQGGMVNVKYKYVPMDWSKAERLMAKEFPRTGAGELVIVEFYLADQSPPDDLKPGRRLVPIDDDDTFIGSGVYLKLLDRGLTHRDPTHNS